MEILSKTGTIFFINRPIEKILEDVNISVRPLLKDNKEKIYELYRSRIDLYKKYAGIEIKNDGDLNEVIDKMIV